MMCTNPNFGALNVEPGRAVWKIFGNRWNTFLNVSNFDLSRSTRIRRNRTLCTIYLRTHFAKPSSRPLATKFMICFRSISTCTPNMLTIYYDFLASIFSLATAQNCSPGRFTYPGRGLFNSCPPGSFWSGKFFFDCSPVSPPLLWRWLLREHLRPDQVSHLAYHVVQV